MIDFTDQVVVVSGAGRGLGRLYALDFAAARSLGRLNGPAVRCTVKARIRVVTDDVVAEIRDGGGVAVAS